MLVKKSGGHSQKYISFVISVIQYHQWCINIDLSTLQLVYSPPTLGHMVNKVSLLIIHQQSISSLYQNGPVSPKKQVLGHSQLVTGYLRLTIEWHVTALSHGTYDCRVLNWLTTLPYHLSTLTGVLWKLSHHPTVYLVTLITMHLMSLYFIHIYLNTLCLITLYLITMFLTTMYLITLDFITTYLTNLINMYLMHLINIFLHFFVLSRSLEAGRMHNMLPIWLASFLFYSSIPLILYQFHCRHERRKKIQGKFYQKAWKLWLITILTKQSKWCANLGNVTKSNFTKVNIPRISLFWVGQLTPGWCLTG